MATTGQDDITVTTSWIDAAVANTALASADCVLQNISPGRAVIQVAGGGAEAPDGSGFYLWPGDSVVVNSGTVWVRSDAGGPNNVKLAVSLI